MFQATVCTTIWPGVTNRQDSSIFGLLRVSSPGRLSIRFEGVIGVIERCSRILAKLVRLATHFIPASIILQEGISCLILIRVHTQIDRASKSMALGSNTGCLLLPISIRRVFRQPYSRRQTRTLAIHQVSSRAPRPHRSDDCTEQHMFFRLQI